MQGCSPEAYYGALATKTHRINLIPFLYFLDPDKSGKDPSTARCSKGTEAGEAVLRGRGALLPEGLMGNLAIRGAEGLQGRRAPSRDPRMISRKQPKKKGKPNSRTS